MAKLEEPDKGRAWVVAVASCFLSVVIPGFVSSSGLLYVAIIETYGVSREDATIPFTVRSAVRCLAGPLVGVVGQRYGVRAVTFWGGVIASLGVILSSFAPNIIWLSVFLGGMFGLGFSLNFTLFQVAINQYFEKYRATACGIAGSGTFIGALVIPIIIESVLGTYGLSAGLLVLGGVVMHTLPPSLLLKSPPWIENPEQYARLKALKTKQESSISPVPCMADPSPAEYNEEHCRELGSLKGSESLNTYQYEELDSSNLNRNSGKKRSLNAITFQNLENKSCEENVVCTMYNIKKSPQLNTKSSIMNGKTESIENSCECPIPTISGDLEKDRNIVTKSTPNDKTPKMSSGNQISLLKSIRGIGDLITNPGYVLVNICMVVYTCNFVPIFTVIVDYGKDKGIAETHGKYFIFAISLGTFIGKICFGWVTDKKFLTVPHFMAVAFLLKGVCITLLPVSMDLYSFLLLLGLYGISTGIVTVHFAILIIRYVDLDLQSVAMGCESFLSGGISFAFPFMIGYFRDNIGSYDGMFYLTGAMSLISGGLWFLEPFLLNFHRKKSERKSLRKEMCEQNKPCSQC